MENEYGLHPCRVAKGSLVVYVSTKHRFGGKPSSIHCRCALSVSSLPGDDFLPSLDSSLLSEDLLLQTLI